MSASERDTDAAAFCADLVRSHDFARYASTLFVPPGAAARAAGAVCLQRRDCPRPRAGQPAAARRNPAAMVDATCWPAPAMAASRAIRSRPNCCSRSAIASCRSSALSRLIDEHQFDLYNDPMPTMAALEGYLNDTAAALFALAARIVGPPSAEVEHLARHAGLAQGIVAGDRGAAARCLAPAIVRAAAAAGAARQQHGGGVRRQADADDPRRAGPADRARRGSIWRRRCAAGRCAARRSRPVFLPLALVRRDLARMSRADTDPFVPHAPSRFRDPVDAVAGVAVADASNSR